MCCRPMQKGHEGPTDRDSPQQQIHRGAAAILKPSLVKALEEGNGIGIGTEPSTYASIIHLGERSKSTSKRRYGDGHRHTRQPVRPVFTTYVDYDFTQKMEARRLPSRTASRSGSPVMEKILEAVHRSREPHGSPRCARGRKVAQGPRPGG